MHQKFELKNGHIWIESLVVYYINICFNYYPLCVQGVAVAIAGAMEQYKGMVGGCCIWGCAHYLSIQTGLVWDCSGMMKIWGYYKCVPVKRLA